MGNIFGTQKKKQTPPREEWKLPTFEKGHKPGDVTEPRRSILKVKGGRKTKRKTKKTKRRTQKRRKTQTKHKK